MSQSEYDRIAALTTEVAKLNMLLNTSLTATNSRLRKLEQRMEGPPDDPEKGVVVRLDRAAETQKRQSRVIWLIVGALVAEIVHNVVTVAF